MKEHQPRLPLYGNRSRKLHRELPPRFQPRPQTLHNMGKKSAIPDAWDDDWEAQADKADAVAELATAEKEAKISKAERLAQHAETNKKIWESAFVPKSCSRVDMLIAHQRGARNLSFLSYAGQCPFQAGV